MWQTRWWYSSSSQLFPLARFFTPSTSVSTGLPPRKEDSSWTELSSGWVECPTQEWWMVEVMFGTNRLAGWHVDKTKDRINNLKFITKKEWITKRGKWSIRWNEWKNQEEVDHTKLPIFALCTLVEAFSVSVSVEICFHCLWAERKTWRWHVSD